MKTRQFIVISAFLLVIIIELWNITSKLNILERTDGVIRVMYEHTYSIKNDVADIVSTLN